MILNLEFNLNFFLQNKNRLILLEDSRKNGDDYLYQTISTFLVELHVDVVLEVLLVVGFEFLSHKLVDKYQEKIH